ncbi:peptidase [Priestia koreensis]|uniref:Acetylornithine deacetylase n=1 Tax=Priestia koreensis TaxID=284581 RepID=A0A0M0LIJ6_9BACI|nr:peptidase [Priestia koreensis]KOO50806.1 acetylornithine deacetylase [Priestia koreensis]
MNEQASAIHEWIQKHEAKGIRMLKRFVQEASTQGNEKNVQAMVVEKLRQLGLEIDIWEPKIRDLKKHEAFVTARSSFRDSPNVVGVWKGSGGGRSLILNGHIDVVPEGDVKLWEDDPFSGKVKDGRLYGRGSTDMKGGNVAMILALEALISLDISLKGDVIFQSVIEEESGGAGTLACIERGYRADAAIIPEPTNMKIFPKQQGSMWFRVVVHGMSAHGGTRYEGVSAIEKAMKVVQHLQEFEKVRNARITDPLYQSIPIPLPINIGKISGGSWPSSVPDEVTIEGRIGVGPHETLTQVREETATWLQKLSEIDSWFESHPTQLEWFGAHWLPSQMNIEHDLVTILTAQFRGVLGKDPILEASPWGTDGGLLTNVGDTPTIVFGPGQTEMAHFPNEYIELKKVFEAAEILALTIVEWCGQSK